MADEAIPVAQQVYKDIEKATGQSFFNAMALLEIFDSVKTKNDWMMRHAEGGLSGYIKKFFNAGEISQSINAPYGGVVLANTYRLVPHVFVNALRKYFSDTGILREEKLLPEDVLVEDNKIKWKNITAEKIIFCEGFAAAQNPFFQTLPFQLSKGELLTIYCDQLPQEYIINQSIFILPAGNHHFIAGSTYQWNWEDINPAKAAAEELESKLKKIISADYRIINQHAAIRPTVKNRRPFIGMHPVHKTVGIFNGFGTKAVMLCPYFAKKFADELTGNHNIEAISI